MSLQEGVVRQQQYAEYSRPLPAKDLVLTNLGKGKCDKNVHAGSDTQSQIHQPLIRGCGRNLQVAQLPARSCGQPDEQ